MDLQEVEEERLAGRMMLPERTVGPLRSVLIRAAIALSCIVIAALLVYAQRTGYNDSAGGTITLLDAFYFATVSLSTTGYGDITPTSDAARLTNILIITPLRLLFLIVLVGTTVEVLTRRTREQFREQRWSNQVSMHTVVVGYGVKGRSAVETLLENGTDPMHIMVVSNQALEIADATRDGVAGMIGDARREEVLQHAGVARANQIIVATDSDDTTVLITLTARRLAPKTCTIVVSARETQNAAILRQSGADGVIPTSDAAGRLLALSLISPTAGAIMEDLLDPTEGLEIVERPVTSAEIGLNRAEIAKEDVLLLAVVRDGVSYRFDSADCQILQRGDILVTIAPPKDGVQAGPDAPATAAAAASAPPTP